MPVTTGRLVQIERPNGCPAGFRIFHVPVYPSAESIIGGWIFQMVSRLRRVLLDARLSAMHAGLMYAAGATETAQYSPDTGLYWCHGMRVIALSTLKAFLGATPAHAPAREPAMAWYRQVKAADWASPADVKLDVRSVSILKDGRAVFNIAGNKYRIVVWINYPYRVVYIRFIGTHRMYDAIDAQTI